MCIAYHASSRTYLLHLCSYPSVLLNFSTSFSKMSHQYNTWANSKKKMENIEQENRELRNEVTTLKADLVPQISPKIPLSSPFINTTRSHIRVWVLLLLCFIFEFALERSPSILNCVSCTCIILTNIKVCM